MEESISGDATAASWNQQCSEEHLAEIAVSIAVLMARRLSTSGAN